MSSIDELECSQFYRYSIDNHIHIIILIIGEGYDRINSSHKIVVIITYFVSTKHNLVYNRMNYTSDILNQTQPLRRRPLY